MEKFIRLVQKLITSKEIKICLLILEEYIIEYNNKNKRFINYELSNIKEKTEKKLLKSSKKYTKMILNGDISPRILVVRIMYHTCIDEARKDRNPFWEAFYTNIGENNFQIAKKCLKTLISLNDIDESTYENIVSNKWELFPSTYA